MGKWDNLFPVTLAANVFDTDGESVEDTLGEKADKNKTPEKKSVDTTTGKWWSDSVEHLEVDLNGGKSAVKTIPTEYKEKVVLLGSSTTEGNGAANRSDAWFNIIKSRMGDNYIFYNRGYGGNNTQDVINRFYKDVAPLDPDFVFIQLTIGNEGIYTATDKQAVYKQFLDNIIKIARMVYQIGATPIIVGQGPTKRYNAMYYRMGYGINDTLASMGYYVINIMGSLAPQETPWYSEIPMKDNLHYNELGQEHIASTISPTLLRHIQHKERGDIQSYGGTITVKNPSTSTPLIYRKPENDEIKSFTFFTRLKVINITRANGVASFNNMARLALSSVDGRFILWDDNGQVMIDDFDPYKNKWISLAYVYSDLDKRIYFYINGDLVKTIENANIDFKVLNIGGRETATAQIEDAEYSDIVLYRTALTNKQVLNLHLGVIPQSSLEIYAPLTDNMINNYAALTNLAPTDAALMIPPDESGVRKKVRGFVD